MLIYFAFVVIYLYFTTIDVLLCSSHTPINEFLIDSSNEANYNNPDNIDINKNDSVLFDTNPSIFFKVKRSFSWYFVAKNSGKFDNYNQFKNTYESNKIKLWDMIKMNIRIEKETFRKKKLEQGIREQQITDARWKRRKQEYLAMQDIKNAQAREYSEDKSLIKANLLALWRK